MFNKPEKLIEFNSSSVYCIWMCRFIHYILRKPNARISLTRARVAAAAASITASFYFTPFFFVFFYKLIHGMIYVAMVCQFRLCSSGWAE